MSSNIRILICKDCQSTETIPDYAGNPRDDVALEYACAKHEYPDGSRHLGGRLFTVSETVWNNEAAKNEILKQIWQKAGHTGMDPWVYDTTDTLRADAMQCWRDRLRPSRCSDFHSDKKILLPPTRRDRKSEGMPAWNKSHKAPQRYLCDYCPMRSVAEQEMRQQQGLYE